MDTVDYAPTFQDVSISGGILNVAKAIDILDDIVVLQTTPRGSYVRGHLVEVVDGKERDDPRICRPHSAVEGQDDVTESTLRDARRIVIDENGKKAKIVLYRPGDYSYSSCEANADALFRLKGSNIPDFKLSKIKEIIPRPYWLPIDPGP